LLLVVDPSFTVDVTVKVVEVACNVVSDVLTETERPERVIQEADGVEVRVSVCEHPDS